MYETYFSIRRYNVPAKTKTLALFDFDHTITTADTFLAILVFLFGRFRFFTGLVACSPTLVMYLLGLRSNERAKSVIISFFFRGMSREEFTEKCRYYSLSGIDRVARAEALERILWHKKQKHTVIIISASLENWIKPWAEKIGVDDVIATIPEFSDGVVTGRLVSGNCSGKRKVSRLLEKYPNAEKCTVYAYGDSSGDRALLEFADYPFYRKFQ
jgi:phosphatidylglycerophosphatase C